MGIIGGPYDSHAFYTMNRARPARPNDLDALLALFRVSEVSVAVEPKSAAERIWAELIACPTAMVFVFDTGQMLTATCMLITAPNLLRGGRQHGFLENVVTHPDYRGRGHGQAVVAAAMEAAWAQNCHHIFLQSGRKDPRVHRFYERCGFEPGVRTAYVARNPMLSVI